VLAKGWGTRACPPSFTSSSTPPIQFHLSVGVVDYRGRGAETRGMPGWRGRPSLPARSPSCAPWPRHLDGDGNVYRRSHEIGWFTGYYLGRSPLTINFAAMRERERSRVDEFCRRSGISRSGDTLPVFHTRGSPAARSAWELLYIASLR